MLIAHGTLIMALDGARMSLFRNSGTDRKPKLELLAEDKRKMPSTAEMGDDRPGRAFQSVGSARGAYETTDWHQRQEEEFVEEMAELFDSHMAGTENKGMLIAPPPVLGHVRKHLRTGTRSKLIAEIDRDYAGCTPLEVAELLDGLAD